MPFITVYIRVLSKTPNAVKQTNPFPQPPRAVSLNFIYLLITFMPRLSPAQWSSQSGLQQSEQQINNIVIKQSTCNKTQIQTKPHNMINITDFK